VARRCLRFKGLLPFNAAEIDSNLIAFNEHHTGDGATIFEHACALGCEGIVSKRLGSSYRSGRVDCWVKVKNPAAPAVKREAEEEWN
jgi:bifunctional non-homologous end joining protein LigD